MYVLCTVCGNMLVVMRVERVGAVVAGDYNHIIYCNVMSSPVLHNNYPSRSSSYTMYIYHSLITQYDTTQHILWYYHTITTRHTHSSSGAIDSERSLPLLLGARLLGTSASSQPYYSNTSSSTTKGQGPDAVFGRPVSAGIGEKEWIW